MVNPVVEALELNDKVVYTYQTRFLLMRYVEGGWHVVHWYETLETAKVAGEAEAAPTVVIKIALPLY